MLNRALPSDVRKGSAFPSMHSSGLRLCLVTQRGIASEIKKGPDGKAEPFRTSEGRAGTGEPIQNGNQQQGNNPKDRRRMSHDRSRGIVVE